MRLDAEYVLPLVWTDDHRSSELVRYLDRLVQVVDVTVVDGSVAERFVAHGAAFPPGVRHIAPTPSSAENGKVAGVLTGVRAARHEYVVIADDDVRYEPRQLEMMVRLMTNADLVRPQNVFSPLPWHARWDSARILINRAFGADYPGTLAVRRSTLLAAGGYDGNALFENLELIRTIRAVDGREIRANDLFVRRLPPTVQHFRSQRVRQSYDSFAQPFRLAVELSILPMLLLSVRRPPLAAALVAVSIGLAAAGRRGAARRVFPASTVLWAPLWVLERGVCVWFAAFARAHGGVRYHGRRIHLAAHSVRALKRSVRVDG